MTDSAPPATVPATQQPEQPEQPDRTKFIGGSDIAAILGISPWRTAVQLWKDKITPRVADDGRPKRKQLSRGHRWESVVAEMLVEELRSKGRTVEVVSSNKRYIDETFPYFACEIDFELKLDGADEITNCELKTVHPFKMHEWGDSGSDELPVWYTAQAMWGLGITGRRECIVAPLFGADEIRTYPVLRDDETITAMREKASEFWNAHVLPKIPPKPRILADLDVLFPTDSEAGALLADADLTERLLRLRAVDRELKARYAEFDALEFEIKRAMGDCTEIVIGDKTAVTWKARAHSYLDQAGLKEAYPQIVKDFTRKGSGRVFSLRQFAWKE